MFIKDYDPAILLKGIRTQRDPSQEDPARETRGSFATVNRRENERVAPSRLAVLQIEA